jgi:hypothetical protein
MHLSFLAQWKLHCLPFCTICCLHSLYYFRVSFGHWFQFEGGHNLHRKEFFWRSCISSFKFPQLFVHLPIETKPRFFFCDHCSIKSCSYYLPTTKLSKLSCRFKFLTSWKHYTKWKGWMKAIGCGLFLSRSSITPTFNIPPSHKPSLWGLFPYSLFCLLCWNLIP